MGGEGIGGSWKWGRKNNVESAYFADRPSAGLVPYPLSLPDKLGDGSSEATSAGARRGVIVTGNTSLSPFLDWLSSADIFGSLTR